MAVEGNQTARSASELRPLMAIAAIEAVGLDDRLWSVYAIPVIGTKCMTLTTKSGLSHRRLSVRLFLGQLLLAALQFVLDRFADEHGQPPVADERFNAADRINR